MMDIARLEENTCCDVAGCKSLASHKICGFERTKKELHLCEKCLNKLYCAIGKNVVPRAVENQFKNPKKIREE